MRHFRPPNGPGPYRIEWHHGHQFFPWLFFVIFLVLVGLGVFFVAMQRGARGARASLYTEAKVGQRLVTLGIAVIIGRRLSFHVPRRIWLPVVVVSVLALAANWTAKLIWLGM